MSSQCFRDLFDAAAVRECSKRYTVRAMRAAHPDWRITDLSRLADSLSQCRAEFLDAMRFETHPAAASRPLPQFICPHCQDANCLQAIPMYIVPATPGGK